MLGVILIVLSALIVIFCITTAVKDSNDRYVEDAREAIIKTKIVHVGGGKNSISYTSTHGAFGRAAVGWAVAGPIGGLIGAATAGSHTYTKAGDDVYHFMVYYCDCTRELVSASEKDPLFEVYIEKLDLGDDEDYVHVDRSMHRELLEYYEYEEYEDDEYEEELDEELEEDEIGELPENPAVLLPEPRHDDAKDLDMLNELQRAYHLGIITREEFIAKRKKLLGK